MNKRYMLLSSILIVLESSIVFMGCDSSAQSLNKATASYSAAANISVKSDNPKTESTDTTQNSIPNAKGNAAEPSVQNSSNASKVTEKSAPAASPSAAKPNLKPIEKTPVTNKIADTPSDNTNTSEIANANTPSSANTTTSATAITKATSNNSSESNTANNGTSIQPENQVPVKVTEKDIRSFSQRLNCDIKIPVIEGLKDTSIQTNINNLFEYDMLSFKSIMEEQAQTGFEESQKENYPFRQYTADTTYTVHYNQNGILSITITYYQFTGGAHGMTTEKAYNYDLSTGKMLKLSDLFPKNSNYNQVIDTEILNALNSDPSKYFSDSATSFKNIDVNNKYYIENGSLVIYYDLYDIAPYVSGIPEFKIPFSKLTFIDTLNIK